MREGKHRQKRSRQYEILVVAVGEGEKPRRFRLSRAGIAGIAVLGILACVGITLAALIYTPVAMYVPIPNPLLEQRYGQQIVETQQRLNDLAEEVLLLRDYNLQLRKAMGEHEKSGSDSSVYPPSLMAAGGASQAASPPPEIAADQLGAETGSLMTDRDAGSTFGVLPVRDEQLPTGLPLMMPTDGFVSQEFDPASGHFGMDIAGKRGTPVAAAADGHVLFAGWTYDDGNMIILSHGGGYATVYKHNQALLKTPQTAVKRGEPIALLGTSGETSLGPHLHFEVWKDGVPRDPGMFLLGPSSAPH